MGKTKPLNTESVMSLGTETGINASENVFSEPLFHPFSTELEPTESSSSIESSKPALTIIDLTSNANVTQAAVFEATPEVPDVLQNKTTLETDNNTKFGHSDNVTTESGHLEPALTRSKKSRKRVNMQIDSLSTSLPKKKMKKGDEPKPINVSPSTEVQEKSSLKICIRRVNPTDTSSDRSGTAQKTAIYKIFDLKTGPGESLPARRGRFSSTSSHSPNSSSSTIRVGDIVWAKLAGYPHWPSRVSAIWARSSQSSQTNASPYHPESTQNDQRSLTVSEVPSDASLAAGFIAQVDWFAWSQCSYLNCTKLWPFEEYYTKLYNPRTRVKGYTDAIKIARSHTGGSSSSANHSRIPSSPKVPNSTVLNTSAPPSTDSPWSANSFVQSFNEFPAPFQTQALNAPEPTKPPCNEATVASRTVSPSTLIQELPAVNLNKPIDSLGDTFVDALPCLDVDGLVEFDSHVPTFSDDDEDEDASLHSITKLYSIDF